MPSKPLIIAALGARGTGKSAWACRLPEYAKASRLAVWDFMQEPAHAHLQGTDKLGDFVRAMKARTFRLAFYPSRDDELRARQFDAWCAAMLAAGRVTAHVEELAFVTKALKAPPQWREMCLVGRHDRHRITIIGTSQRPAQVDKEFLGNADVIHCGRLVAKGDAQAAAEVLGVHRTEIMQLPDLHWIERRQGDTEPRRGVLSFATKAPRAAKPQGAQPKAKDLQSEGE